jgi:iron complex transport system substrate-binding protein
MERNLPGLERLGVPFLVLEPKSLEDVFKDIETIGAATGTSEAACRLIADLRARIEPVRARAGEAAGRPTLYWEWWPKPLISPGRWSWMVQIGELAGADLIFKDVEATSFVVEESQVCERDPDFVMLCWCGTLQEKMHVSKVRERPGWERLQAVKQGRVHCFPSNSSAVPDPASSKVWSAWRPSFTLS